MPLVTDSFEQDKAAAIDDLGRNDDLRELSRRWMEASAEAHYSYHFTWLGLPIIQYPQDIVAIQEIVWSVKPDLIIETGVARGGSIILHASLLELIGGQGIVAGIDVDIRSPSRAAIEGHRLARRVRLFEGSSTSPDVAKEIAALAATRDRVLVILDSNHTHDHVAKELSFYAHLVTPGSYLIVLDTIIEDLPEGSFPDRPWDKGNNPRTAVDEFLELRPDFNLDSEYEHKLLISTAPGGYLRRKL